MAGVSRKIGVVRKIVSGRRKYVFQGVNELSSDGVFSGARAIMHATVQSRAITRRASYLLLPSPSLPFFIPFWYIRLCFPPPFLTALPFRFCGRYNGNQSVTDARNFVRWWRNRGGTSELATRVSAIIPR